MIILKVLIVDDENIICEGMKIFIQWNHYGYDIPDTADNGYSALSMMDRNSYDLVITDIRMPGIDGLELSRIISERKSKCDVLIMSGYKDFDYAQSAMEFGVSRYLLKPLQEDILIDVLVSVKEKVEKNANKRLEEQQVLHQIRKSLLQNLSNNCGDSIQAVFLDEHFFLYDFQYIMYIIKIFQNEDVNLIGRLAGLRPLRDLTVFNFKPWAIGLLYKIIDETNDSSAFIKDVQRVMEEFRKYYMIIVGAPVHGSKELLNAHQLISSAFDISFYYPSRKVLLCSELNDNPTLPLENFNLNIESICNKILCEDTTAVMIEVDHLIHSLTINKIPLTIRMSITTSMIMRILNIITSTGGYVSDIFGDELDIAEYYTIPNIQMLEDRLKSDCIAVINYISKKKNRRIPHYLNKVVDFIENNYQTPITNKSLSTQFYMNPTYLGRKFKECTGMGISEYVNFCRIKHVKKLLLDETIKASSIFSQVGYADMDTYYAQFKKIVGMNPSQYRALYIYNPVSSAE